MTQARSSDSYTFFNLLTSPEFIGQVEYDRALATKRGYLPEHGLTRNPHQDLEIRANWQDFISLTMHLI